MNIPFIKLKAIACKTLVATAFLATSNVSGAIIYSDPSDTTSTIMGVDGINVAGTEYRVDFGNFTFNELDINGYDRVAVSTASQILTLTAAQMESELGPSYDPLQFNGISSEFHGSGAFIMFPDSSAVDGDTRTRYPAIQILTGLVTDMAAVEAPWTAVIAAPYVTGAAITAVPLPPAMWLLGSGVLGLVGWQRQRRLAH